jgi:hypothetical protein
MAQSERVVRTLVINSTRCLFQSPEIPTRVSRSASQASGTTNNIRIKACLRFSEGGKGKWPFLDVDLFLLIPALADAIADHECFTPQFTKQNVTRIEVACSSA